MRLVLLLLSISLPLAAASYAQDAFGKLPLRPVPKEKQSATVSNNMPAKKQETKTQHNSAAIGYPMQGKRLDNLAFPPPVERQNKEGKTRARVNSLEARYLYGSGQLVDRQTRYLHSLSRLEHSGTGTKAIAAILAKLSEKRQKFVAGYVVPNLNDPEFPDITIGNVAWRKDVVDSSGNHATSRIIARVDVPKRNLTVDVAFAFSADPVRSDVEVKIVKSGWAKDRDSFILNSIRLRANADVDGSNLPGTLLQRDDQVYVLRLPTSREGAYALLKLLADGRWFDLVFKDKAGSNVVVTFERTQFGEAALLLAARGSV